MLHQCQQNKNMVTDYLSQDKGTFWIPDTDTHTSTIKMRGRRNINITLIPTWHKVLPTKRYHCCRSANYGWISSSNRLLRLLLRNTIKYGGNISKLSINDKMRSLHNNHGANLRNIIPNSKIPFLPNIRKRWCQSLTKFNGQSFQQQKNSISCRSSRRQGVLDSSRKVCHLRNLDIKKAIEKYMSEIYVMRWTTNTICKTLNALVKKTNTSQNKRSSWCDILCWLFIVYFLTLNMTVDKKIKKSFVALSCFHFHAENQLKLFFISLMTNVLN